jgi:hypothetical protein
VKGRRASKCAGTRYWLLAKQFRHPQVFSFF